MDRAVLARVSEPRWIEALYRRGEILVRQVVYYAKFDGNLIIGDPNEGLLARYPKENQTLQIAAMIGQQRLHLPNSSLTVNDPRRNHGLYCTMAFEPVVTAGGLDLRRTFVPQLENPKHLESDEDEKAVLVFHDTAQFIERLTKAFAEKGYGLYHGAVEYMPMTYAGAMGPFRKLEAYGFQQEYRFLTDKPILKTLKLELGPLDDISSPFAMPKKDP